MGWASFRVTFLVDVTVTAEASGARRAVPARNAAAVSRVEIERFNMIGSFVYG